MKQPMQPIYKDNHGTLRFQENAIVSFLYEYAKGRGMGLNELATMPFSNEDREQFAQLIGYSVSGYGELSYASEESKALADEMANVILNTRQGYYRKCDKTSLDEPDTFVWVPI